MASAPPFVASSEKSLLIFIAYRRGLDEGSPCAQWLNQSLKGRGLTLDAGRQTEIQTYFDQRAPAIHDWTQKWKGDLRTARAMILVCSKGTGVRRSRTDWLYDEIEWWVKTRRTAPILILTNQDDTSVIPPRVFSRWPKAQRIIWSPNSTPEEHDAVLERITEGLIISERGINYEELRRLKIRNRSLATLTLIVLVLGVMALFFARSEREQRRLAERNLQLTYGPNLQVALRSYQQGDIAEMKALLTAVRPELRGYEWNLLRNLADQSERSWTESAEINDLAYSPEGDFLVLARADGKVTVRAMKHLGQRDSSFVADSQREITRQTGQAGGQQFTARVSNTPFISRAVFIGPLSFATTGTDGLVHVWDLSGTSDTLLPTIAPTSRTLVVSPDRQWLASATEDGTIQVWEVKPIRQYETYVLEVPKATFKVEPTALPPALAFSPDSKSLVVVGFSLYIQNDYTPFVQLWDWEAQRRIGFLESKKQVNSVCTLGQTVYGAMDDGSIVTWDLQTQKARVVLNADPERGSLDLITPAPNGHLIAAVAKKRNIILFDPSNNQLRMLTGADTDIKALRFDPEEDILLSAAGRKVRFYDLKRPQPRIDLPFATGVFDWSSEGRVLVTSNEGSVSGSFRIWNFSSNTSFNVPAAWGVLSLVLYPDQSRFVAGWLDGTVQCYRVADGTVIWKNKTRNQVDSLAISSDSSSLLVGSGKNPVVEIWDAQTGQQRNEFPGAGHLNLSQDGRLLATAGATLLHFEGKDVPLFRVYRMEDLKEIISGPARPERPKALAFDPQGKRLAVVDNEIEVWQLGSPPELLQHIPLQRKTASHAAFSPDGSRLAVSIDGALTIWNAETGDLLLRFDDRYYGMMKWVGEKLCVQNQGMVTIFDADLAGLEDWEGN